MHSIFKNTDAVIEPLRAYAETVMPDDPLDRLFDKIGDARLVLLGEASHGTSDYYTWRAKISRRLIRDKGFNFIAVEGDWPDCYEVNRYVKGWRDHESKAQTVLHEFDRWPTWMWANWEIVALSNWLRRHNKDLPDDQRVGFYGIDVYSLWESLEAMLNHLELSHPEAYDHALKAIQCFEPFNREGQEYAWYTRFSNEHCEDELIDLLVSLRSRAAKNHDDPEAHFDAEQNAWAALGAERYYRSMVRGDNESWNLRDTHMADTLDRLLDKHGPTSKGIVWEHNTHIGDARATDMADAGMTNMGALARERHYGDGVVLVGFGSYEGSVIAGRRWGAPMESMPVPKARAGSWEDLLHEAQPTNQLLIMDDFSGIDGFAVRRGHRAIGVVYNPEFEKLGNYVPTYLGQRYDAFIYLDGTEALHPLKIHERAPHEPPETFPWGF